jgi:hypothetical protein
MRWPSLSYIAESFKAAGQGIAQQYRVKPEAVTEYPDSGA